MVVTPTLQTRAGRICFRLLKARRPGKEKKLNGKIFLTKCRFYPFQPLQTKKNEARKSP